MRELRSITAPVLRILVTLTPLLFGVAVLAGLPAALLLAAGVALGAILRTVQLFAGRLDAIAAASLRTSSIAPTASEGGR